MISRNENCRLCPLHKTAQSVCIWGETIGEDPDVFVVGEAPGAEEDKRERPFIGKSGQLLREELERAGIKRYYLTNPVKCRPPDNRKPTPEEIKACRPYLDAELAAVKPKWLVTAGALPSKLLLRESKITQAHGKRVERPEYTGYPVFHPAYVLRDPSHLPAFRHDLERLKRQLSGKKPADDVVWEIVTAENLQRFIREFQEAPEFSFDLETSGLFPYDRQGFIRCIGIGLEKRSWVIPGKMPGSPYAGRPKLLSLIVKILVDLAKGKTAIAQNGKFDNQWLEIYTGFKFHLDFDTMLASHLLDENEEHDLKYMARAFLDAPEYDLTKKEKQGGVAPERLYEYNAKDCAYTLRLKWVFEKALKADLRLRRLYYRLIMPAARALETIEQEGLTLDLKRYAATEAEKRAEREQTLAWLNRLAEQRMTVNWNAPAQVGKLLFEKLKLPVTVRTPKGAPSTGEEALADLKGKHPIVDKLIEYRELEKFIGTYLEGWKEFIVDGYLYLGYKIHGTVTGRYSSRLHQIPRDGSIRNLVTAPPGWEFVQADLSQAELRIAAELSGDLELSSAYREGRDVHWVTLMHMIGAGATDATEMALETAKMYCVQNEVPTDGTGCEVLQGVWKANLHRETTPALLELCRKIGKNQVPGSRERRESVRFKESLLERRDLSLPSEEMEEKLLRALWQYEELRRSSQGRGSKQQSRIQLSDALSLLSSSTASEAQKLYKDVWKEWRKKSKSIGFGFIFGMFEKKFIEQAKTKYGYTPTWDEAHAFRQAYFELYPGIPAWHEKQKTLVRLDGQVADLFGRIRRLPGINSSDRELRSESERQAINSPVQGTIGDWKAAALVEIHETIDRDKLRLVGEHHDALLMIVRADEKVKAEVLPKVREIMRKPRLLEAFHIEMKIPMDVEIAVGPWGDGSKYDG